MLLSAGRRPGASAQAGFSPAVHIFPRIGRTSLHGEASLLAIETTLAVLRRGGFNPAQASEVARSALWTALTLVMSEPGYYPALSPAERAEHQRQGRIRLAMLPPDRFPELVAAAGPMTSCDDPDSHYQFGTDLFIVGVVAVAPRGGAG